jgi:hypothetical protein
LATKKVPAQTKRATQPQRSVLVDWSNPVTKGLSLAFIGGSPVDHTRQNRLVANEKITTSVNAGGRSSIGSGTSYYTVSPPLPDSGTEFSVVATVRYAAVGEQGYFSKVTGANQGQWNFLVTTPISGSKVRLEVINGSTSAILGSTTLVDGRIYVIAATYKLGAVSIYVNGVLDGTGTSLTLAPSSTPVSTLLSHDPTGSYYGPFPATGGVNFLGVWNKRALSPAEIKKISSNVWSVFQQSPAKSSLWLNQLEYRLATRLTNTGDYFVNGYLDEVSKNISSVDSSSILYASEFDEVTFKKYYFELPLLANKITQPQYATKIDWSNPITKGLVICTHAGTNFTELVSGNFSTITSAKQTATKNGKAFSNISSNFSIDTKVTTSFPDPVTWVCGITPNSTGGGGFGRIFDKRSAGNGTQVELLYFNTTLAPEFNRGTSQQTVRATTALTANVYTVVAVTSATFTGTNNAVYYNGVNQLLAFNSGGTVAIPTNAASYVLGNRTDDSLRNFDGKISFAYRWNRVLSPAEIASISANPYQIFKSSNQSVYISRNKNLARSIASTGNTYITGSFDEYTKIS